MQLTFPNITIIKCKKLIIYQQNHHLIAQTAVMPRYFYRSRFDVENDIVFYSEDGGDHKFRYADSIGMIVKRENDLKMKAYVITMDDAQTFKITKKGT